MNVLNVEAVERELARCGTYARHPAVRTWVTTVARNHILSTISDKDRDANFVLYTGKRNPLHIEMPLPSGLPPWAKTALKEHAPIHWFDTVQVRRRNIWQAVEQIIHWFNNWPDDDKRLNRLSRMNFETAASSAAMWFCDVQSNLWDYVKDCPPVVCRFDDDAGFYFVKLVTPLHFERESRMMSHCVGNGTYYNQYKQGTSEYYSLRDQRNEPHATLEVLMRQRGFTADQATGYPMLNQCKGKANHRPDERYQPYLASFIAERSWGLGGDSSNINMQARRVRTRK